jgi:hypothetical protein
MADEIPIIRVGGVTVRRNETATRQPRISALAWGDAGAGKTTLAATMPGRKLWFQFDPDGVDSIIGVSDIDVADFSSSAPSVSELFKDEGSPLGIRSVLEQYDSFIFDSLTNITDKTLLQGIDTVKGATIERPSPGAYGTRNALAVRLVKNVLRVTGKANKHVLFIAHEGAPTTNEATGAILHISLALGGQLPNNIGIDFSEFWAMYQVDNRSTRRIAIRPSRQRKPMKTRMFRQNAEPEFDWNFDAEDWNNEKNNKFRMDTWYNMWVAHGEKLPLPGTPLFDKLYAKYIK